MKIRNTKELREVLLATIAEVKESKTSPKEAMAISALTSRVLQSAALDMKVAQYLHKYGRPKTVTMLTE